MRAYPTTVEVGREYDLTVKTFGFQCSDCEKCSCALQVKKDIKEVVQDFHQQYLQSTISSYIPDSHGTSSSFHRLRHLCHGFGCVKQRYKLWRRGRLRRVGHPVPRPPPHSKLDKLHNRGHALLGQESKFGAALHFPADQRGPSCQFGCHFQQAPSSVCGAWWRTYECK